jgi:predicted  nucleic acid-binding Zn-ribbon protein
MTIEELRQAKREELTIRPTEEQIDAAVRQGFLDEVASKVDRVNQLEAELATAKASLAETEATITALDPVVEAPAEEVQG